MKSLKKIIYPLIIIFSLLSVSFLNNRNIENNEVNPVSTEGYYFNKPPVMIDASDSEPNLEQGNYFIEAMFALTVPVGKEDERVGELYWMKDEAILNKTPVSFTGVANGNNSYVTFYYEGPPGIYSGTNFLLELDNGVTIGGEPGDNSWIPSFQVGVVEPGLEPIINSTEVKTKNNKATVSYDLTLKEGTTVNKIEVLDESGKSYGSISGSVKSSGTIELKNLETKTTYDDLYIEVTYNDFFQIGGQVNDNSWIPSFTTGHSAAIIYGPILGLLFLTILITLITFIVIKKINKSKIEKKYHIQKK